MKRRVRRSVLQGRTGPRRPGEALVDPTGSMCNGKVRGVAQWLSGRAPYVITFEVPILTTSFPGSNAGPQ
jgi:hypothetical protein